MLLAVHRKFNRDLAAALTVVQREFAVVNCNQGVKTRPLGCVDPDLMAVQVQPLAAAHLNFFVLTAQRIIDVCVQYELS